MFGLSITSAVAIYFVIWWVVLFAILPFGVRTQQDVGDITMGTTESAPVRPMMMRKALVTTVVAAIVFAVFVMILQSGMTLDDIPLPGFEE